MTFHSLTLNATNVVAESGQMLVEDLRTPSSAAFTSHEECPRPLVSTDTTTTSCEFTEKGDDASIQSAPAAMSAASEVSPSSTKPDDSLEFSRNSTRRRTWFSSTTNEELDTPSTPNFVSGSHSDKPEDQNHTQESDIPISHADQPKVTQATNDFTEKTSERDFPLTTCAFYIVSPFRSTTFCRSPAESCRSRSSQTLS
jgi:hypothetical protein